MTNVRNVFLAEIKALFLLQYWNNVLVSIFLLCVIHFI